MYSKIVDINARGLLGSFDLTWHLTPGVNILAGGNGSGKSTLLRAVVNKLRTGKMDDLCAMLMTSLDITTTQSAEDQLIVIANFDDLVGSDFSFEGVDPSRKALFFDIIDRLYLRSGKRVVREGAGVRFMLGAIEIPFVALSSGERQVFRLLYSILVSPEASILVLDEPEISLQIDWQKVLLEDILRLNVDLQILVATHSPAIIMNGWVDCVSEISSLSITTPV
ncbi:MAG: AAA family ATPase [Mucinivorans sp.]